MLPPLLALAMLTGHPQEAYYLVIVLSGWVAVAVIHQFRCARGGTRHPAASDDAVTGHAPLSKSHQPIVAWGVVIGLTLGLTAVEVVPVGMAQPWTLPALRYDLGQAGRYHVELLNLFQLLSPTALGGPADYLGHDNYWETVLAFGWVALVLAVIAASHAPWRDAVRPWIALALLTFVFAGGKRLGFFAILYEVVPGMNRFRVPARSLFVTSLAVAVLAGHGVETLRRGSARIDWNGLFRRYRRIAVLIGLAVASGAFAGRTTGVGVSSLEETSDVGRVLLACGQITSEPSFWVVLGSVGVALGVIQRRPWVRSRIAVELGLLAVVELGALGFANVRVAPIERFAGNELDGFPQALPVQYVRHTPITLARPEGSFRVRAQDGFFPDLPAVMRGLEKTNLNDSFQITHAARLYETLYPQFEPPWPKESGNAGLARWNQLIRRSVLDRMGVAYLVTDRPPTDPLPWPVTASGTWRGRPYLIYRNPAHLPRAYVVPRAEVCPEGVMVPAMPFVSPRQAVMMTADPLDGVDGPRQPFRPASYDASNPDRVVVQVQTRAPGLLVVTDTWMPGWTARVDGRPVPILRGDRAWRVVPLREAGQHEVVLSYRPPGLALGGMISVTAIGAWLVLVVRGRRTGVPLEMRRRGSRPPAEVAADRRNVFTG